MASNVPTVRQIAWSSTIPHLMVMGVLVYVFYLSKLGDPFVLGAFSYLILSFSLRSILTRKHIKGMRLVKQEKFADAIPQFEQSIDLFTRNKWMDQYRFFALLSSSKMTYKEMGWCNIAFCYSQTNNGHKAKEYYEMVLAEYPKNGLAKAAINMMKSR